MEKAVRTNINTFDYATNRSIYNECQSMTDDHTPKVEIKFIEKFLKKGYSVIYVTLTKSHFNLTKPFKKVCKGTDCSQLYIIDGFTEPTTENKEDYEIIYLKRQRSLTQISLAISKTWKKTKGKKILFFDFAEYLPTFYGKEPTFKFVRSTIRKFYPDGIVLFCFLKGIMGVRTELKYKHLFDEVIHV